MAAPAAFEIKIIGNGGDASAPHMSVDPIAIDLFGEDNVEVLEKPNMAGEDFAFYLQHVPDSYFMI